MYEKITGNFGEVIYNELFEEYILLYGDEAWFDSQTNKYTHFANQGWRKEKFKKHDELEKFVKDKGIFIVNSSTIKHPFSKGLPDCRCITPDGSFVQYL